MYKSLKELEEDYEYIINCLVNIKQNEIITEKQFNDYYKLLSKKEDIENQIKLKQQKERLTVAVDFDGVINKYKGWNGENDLSVPQSGVKYFLEELNKEYSVIIFTVRDTENVKKWLKKYGLDKYVIHVTDMKPKAIAYIDDRAITYKGNYSEVLKELEEFKTWWEK